MKYFADILINCIFVYQIKQKTKVMKTLNQAIEGDNKQVKEYTTTDGETFHVEEKSDCWEIYSSVFGDEEAATTYDKENWTYDEAVENYRKNGIY